MISFPFKENRWNKFNFGIFLHPAMERPGNGAIYEVFWNENSIFKKKLNPKRMVETDVFFYSLALLRGHTQTNILRLQVTPEKEETFNSVSAVGSNLILP
jgi:hypothetical protein